jgi:hypothetical protein
MLIPNEISSDGEKKEAVLEWSSELVLLSLEGL